MKIVNTNLKPIWLIPYFLFFEEKYIEILQGAFQNPENFNPEDSLREIIKLPEIKNNLINFIRKYCYRRRFP